MNGYIEAAGLLDDFIAEASGVISSIEEILCKLKRVPDDRALLRDIHRGFHTLKGGAAYVNSVEVIRLCRLGEELMEELCNREGTIPPWAIDAISAATAEVRQSLSGFGCGRKPEAATDGHGQTVRKNTGDRSAGVSGSSRHTLTVARDTRASVEPDWSELHRALMQRLAPLGRIRATSSAGAEEAWSDTTDSFAGVAASGADVRHGPSGYQTVGNCRCASNLTDSRRAAATHPGSVPAGSPARDIVEAVDQHLKNLVTGLEQLRRGTREILDFIGTSV